MAVDPLTEQERAMLDLESAFWATQGGKESQIVDRIGVGPVRYYQRLNLLVETEAALAYDPVTVNRLRRLRTKGRADG